jgi:acyl-CoA hydrolase
MAQPVRSRRTRRSCKVRRRFAYAHGMPVTLDAESFAAAFRPGMRVYAPGCGGHSLLFERWLRERPDAADGVEFCGVHIPGVNRFDFGALHPTARMRNIFLSPDWRHTWVDGRFALQPLAYSDFVRELANTRFDLALVQVSPADERGRHSLGIAADFTPAALLGAARVFAHVNPRMPRTNGPWIEAARIDAAVVADEPLLAFPDAAPDAVLDRLADNVAGLVEDGDTLQFGLGRIQAAVLRALGRRRGLRVHSGMVSDSLLALDAAGALAPRDPGAPPVTCGVALGTPALYAAVADPAFARFAPVSHTHDHGVLRAIPNFKSINAAIAVDLLGQACAETLDGAQVSGIGGLLDFARGARASAGGRSILALLSTAKRGTQSRIVPRLGADDIVGVTRLDVDTVVTEHGVAQLRALDVDARAQALIGVAEPAHREGLRTAWAQARARL